MLVLVLVLDRVSPHRSQNCASHHVHHERCPWECGGSEQESDGVARHAPGAASEAHEGELQHAPPYLDGRRLRV